MSSAEGIADSSGKTERHATGEDLVEHAGGCHCRRVRFKVIREPCNAFTKLANLQCSTMWDAWYAESWNACH